MEGTTKAFGWKRKIGDRVNVLTSAEFAEESETVERDLDVDWMTLVAKRQCISLEDGFAKSERLKNEGTTLAEAGRNWEAVKKWDEALLFTPDNEIIHEMKAQVFLELHEIVQAVQSAQKAVSLAPTWWVGHQTLGRAHLSVGDVQSAKLSFCRAIILNPAERELWDEDLSWTLTLINRKREMDRNFDRLTEKATVRELDDPDETETVEQLDQLDLYTSTNEWKQCPNMNRLPQNYVLMR